MPGNRIGRINEEIVREMSALLTTVKDPRVSGLISVTAADTSADLKYCKIYVSILDRENAPQVMKGLKSATGYLRRELGRVLRLRSTPEITFIQDSSIDKGSRILEILRDPEAVKPPNPANEDIVLPEV